MTSSSAAPPRLPLVENPDDPLVREQFDKLAAGSGILNLHRMMAHAPALMKASGDMALAFRRDTKLPRAIAELAILRAAQVLDAPYVWARHVPLARDCGVTARQMNALEGRTAQPLRRCKKRRSVSPRQRCSNWRSTKAPPQSCGAT